MERSAEQRLRVLRRGGDPLSGRAALALVVTLVLALGAAACGGENGDAVGEAVTENVPETTTVPGDVDTERLREEADEIETIVRDDLSRLSEARSLDDVSGALEGTRSRLEQSAEDLRGIDVSDEELARARDEVDTAVGDLSAELEEAEAAVRDEDVTGALRRAAAAVEDRQRVEDALDTLRRELDRVEG